MCPVCDEPLVAFEFSGVEIDRCVRCQGIWLDGGELEWIAHLAGVAPGGLSEAVLHVRGLPGGKRRCPRCRRRLRKVAVSRQVAMEIERCPRGDGLWFDHGEMEALMTAFEGGEEGAVARFFRDLLGKGRRGISGQAEAGPLSRTD